MRGRTIALPLLILFLGFPSRADAPPFHYNSFDTNSTTIRDSKTRLTWQRPPTSTSAVKQTYAAAEAYCATALPSGRVPTVKELQTLVDEQPHVTGGIRRYIDGNAFPADRLSVSAPYWSSSKQRTDGTQYTVKFDTGETSTLGRDDQTVVLCVSGPSP